MLGGPLVLALSDKDVVTLGLVGMGMGVAVVAIIVQAAKRVLRTREIEQTKREVAAYVAEGTITPEDAQRILGGGKNDLESSIGKAVSWGIISSGKAERLIKALRQEFAREEGRNGG